MVQEIKYGCYSYFFFLQSQFVYFKVYMYIWKCKVFKVIKEYWKNEDSCRFMLLQLKVYGILGSGVNLRSKIDL